MLLAISLPTEGKRLTLVPLNATEVYRILREIGREDAVPEGRVVTQGIAAVSGFAAGLAKGIGGALLVDLAANYLASTNAPPSSQPEEPEEICFDSRSINDVYEDDGTPEGRQNDNSLTDVGTRADYYADNNNENDEYGGGENEDTQTEIETRTGSGSAVNCIRIVKS
ncbi:PREDICTED: uncharacterized protein LOC108359011 [Rhagoletis zephyria]|uniref:uncharacterized protein LOC108359011 n=1 Tax=Rhagoletis zephyria TaxID=28612 RepID=UPI0008117002|nr:PREDICTED: uncharacterized protein LOC108359011 [Rhagoletis zephyria]